MMDNSNSPPPANSPAPAGEFDFDGLTPADAKAHLDTMLKDRDATDRYLKGDPLIATAIDALTRRSLAIEDAPEEPGEEQRMLSAGVPATPSDYRINLSAAGSPELSEPEISDRDVLLAVAHDAGLTRDAVQSVVDFARYDIRNGRVCDFESCEATLKKTWAGDFDENNRILGQALREIEAKHPKLTETLARYPALSNSPTLMIEIVHRAKLRGALNK